MAHIADHSLTRREKSRRSRRAARSLLAPPLMLFIAVTIVAGAYVAFILWPRWPQTPVPIDAPAVPVIVAGVAFNVEPAAIRVAMQRRPGTQARLDLAYLWPSLEPPDHAVKPTVAAPLNPNERLFVTITADDGTLSPRERAETIYPRYLADEPGPGPAGLKLQAFRDGTPYQGEDLVFDSREPGHFLARCSRQGVGNSGMCLTERRIGRADIRLRFPRDWLADWNSVASSIDRLLKRIHPENQ